MAVHKWKDIKAKRMKSTKLKHLARKISKPLISIGALLIWPVKYMELEILLWWLIGLSFAPFLFVAYGLGLGLLWLGEKLVEYSQVYVSGFVRDKGDL